MDDSDNIEMLLSLVGKRGAEIERLRATNKQLVSGINTITRRKQKEIDGLRAGIQSLAESMRASLDAAIRQRDEARAEAERLRVVLQDVAEELEGEEPRSDKKIAFDIRNKLEG